MCSSHLLHILGDGCNIMFETIVSKPNLEAAYLELVGKLAETRKEMRYHGIDNYTMSDHDFDSEELLVEIQKELIDKKPIEPALLVEIPKKYNPSKRREIFIYTLKERIKAQAIYRVVLPVFEKHFSDRLFSYRPGKPSYHASYLFARRYKRHFQKDHCLIIDLHNYSNFLNTDLLLQKLAALFPDHEMQEVLKLFVTNQIYEKGRIRPMSQGIVQGVPLIALFANLYLTDLDHLYTRRATFYIRVGDDLAIVDPDFEKLKRIASDLENELAKRGLQINDDKFYIGPSNGEFSFLGYHFSGGCIGLEESFVTKLVLQWKRLLVHKHKSFYQKKMIIERLMRRPSKNFNNEFQEIIKSKSQVTNSEQIKKLSEQFFAILTEFYYGEYTPRNRRLLGSVIREFEIFSLYDYYRNFHYGKRGTAT